MTTVRTHKSFSKSFKWHFKSHRFGTKNELPKNEIM